MEGKKWWMDVWNSCIRGRHVRTVISGDPFAVPNPSRGVPGGNECQRYRLTEKSAK